MTAPLLFLLAWAADPADKAAFEKVCGHCHSTSLITEALTRDEWKETIERMMDVGAQGTADEFVRVKRYLAQGLTRVNVNAADAAELAPVLDISETAAQAIVDYRAQHGRFESLDDLAKAPGMSAAALTPKKDRITFR